MPLKFYLQLRQFLDGVATQLKNLPSRMRQYAAYEYLQKVIKSHQKVSTYSVRCFVQFLMDVNDKGIRMYFPD